MRSVPRLAALVLFAAYTEEIKHYFHGNAELADIQFSLMQVIREYHPRGPGNLGPLMAIETPDPYTAVFKLRHPYPPMMRGLSSMEAPIVPKHLYEGTDFRNNPNNNKPVGSGRVPFQGMAARGTVPQRLPRRSLG